MHARLRRDYTTQHVDPISFRIDETIQVSHRDDEWPEYLWATDPRGRSGWVHQGFLDADNGQALATRDYDARELDALAGDRVRMIEEAGGWWWCENSNGATGWLPARDLDIDNG
jgi:hypothetical protein